MRSEYLTLREFSAIVRRSDVTVRKWMASGRAPRWVKVGGKILFGSREVAAWLRAQPGGGEGVAPKQEA